MMTDPIGIALSFVLLFVQFVVVMKIHHKAHNKVLHFFLVLWFIPQDIAVNLVFITLIGLEWPKWNKKEYLVTGRMKRWKKLEPTQGRRKRWRYTFAHKVCEQLNKYDAGHC